VLDIVEERSEIERPVRDIIVAMPKTEMHVHLDGSLRLETIADLAQLQGVALPVPPERLAEVCVVSGNCRSLVQFLGYFQLPLSVLQTPDALERVTHELCADLAAENVRYVEIRFGPSLHRERGMDLLEIIDAVVGGWRRGQQEFGLTGGVLLSALRHLPPEETMAVARAGLPFLGHGVVGFDLAGDEAHFPVLIHEAPLLWARDAGYGMTVHAGEAAGAQSVRDAVEVIGVSRVGHGVRSEEDRSLLPVLRERRITLDMCPTSNVQTRAVKDLVAHPMGRLHRAGIRVTASTDSRTVSDTTVTQELLTIYGSMGLGLNDLMVLQLNAIEAGFADVKERTALLQHYRDEFAALGLHLS